MRQGDYEVHEMSEEEKIEVKSLVEQIHNFKKDNYKYYRGNVLARLRKQKMRNKNSQESMKIEVMEEQTSVNKQANCA